MQQRILPGRGSGGHSRTDASGRGSPQYSSSCKVERSWSKWAELRGVDPVLTCQTAHGRRAIETVAIMRPDLDAELELKIIEDIEVDDNDGRPRNLEISVEC